MSSLDTDPTFLTPPAPLQPAAFRRPPAAPALCVNAPGVAPAPAADRPAPRIANQPRLEIRAPAFAAVPAVPAAMGGLRVMPLAQFVWSGPAGRARPRGDHTLIWRAPDAAGTAEMRAPAGPVPLVPGALHFLPAGTAFAVPAQPQSQGTVLLIPRDMALGAAAPFPARPISGLLPAADRPSIAAALGAIAAASGAEAPLVARCHLGLIALALGHVRPGVPPAAAGARPAAMPLPDPRMLVDAFMDLAANEAGRGRTLGDLAAVLGTTAGLLDRACIAARGRPAMDIIYEIRRTRAVAMLRETRLAPARIAQMLGFTSLAHMNRQLSAATGRGPQALRNEA